MSVMMSITFINHGPRYRSFARAPLRQTLEPISSLSRIGFASAFLEAYRKTPGTTGTIRRPDRALAEQLYQRGVSASVMENAFLLAAMRRLMRPADAPPLGAIRSLAYFLPVIEEVLGMRVSPDYFQYQRHKLDRVVPTR
jgi:hypothetical protein